MSRFNVYTAVAGLALLGFSPFGFTQTPGPLPDARRPTVSPYLNLVRGGTNPAVNYYGLVRPQQEFRNSLQGLGQRTANAEASIALVNDEGLPRTGHHTMFLNTGGYFFSRTGGNKAVAQSGPAITTRPAPSAATGSNLPARGR